jgi:hypothetical protein
MSSVALQTYKGKHTGEDIYVLASGKSVDYFAPAFFENRITIGVNQMPRIIECTYGVRKEISVALLEEHMDNAKRRGTLFLSQGRQGRSGRANELLVLETAGESAIASCAVVLYDHPAIKKSPPDRLPPPDDQLFVSSSTITTGIHLAAYMGARTVFIVGHDCGTLDGHANCDGYHSVETLSSSWSDNTSMQGEKYKNWLRTIESQTASLRDLVTAKYGCQVVSVSPFVGLNMEGHAHATRCE